VGDRALALRGGGLERWMILGHHPKLAGT
jgi:hypothetical protein